MNRLLSHAKPFLKRNGSTILTCIGGAGVIGTAIMAVKATPKAMSLLEKAKEEKGEELTKLEVVKVAGPSYIPTAMVGVGTLACIFGANVLNQRKQAALTSAYALLDNAYKEYQEKVDELYGEEAGGHIREQIAKDKYEEQEIEITDDENKQLFYDFFSGRYFESTIEVVQQAEYFVNRTLTMREYVYLNEYYEMLDIPPIDSGYELGWSVGSCLACYWQNWIDFNHERVTMDDGLECIIIKMDEPIVDFQNFA